MSKFDTAGYLANLSFIMDFREKLGMQKGPILSKEFADQYNRLEKEIADETRPSQLES